METNGYVGKSSEMFKAGNLAPPGKLPVAEPHPVSQPLVCTGEQAILGTPPHLFQATMA